MRRVCSYFNSQHRGHHTLVLWFQPVKGGGCAASVYDVATVEVYVHSLQAKHVYSSICIMLV
jgi:hypothetical protein